MIKNLISLHDAREIRNHMKDEFDTHDFIKELRHLHEQEYLSIAERYRTDSFRTANSLIARFLSANVTELEITKVEDMKSRSKNVHKNQTSCTLWRKN